MTKLWKLRAKERVPQKANVANKATWPQTSEYEKLLKWKSHNKFMEKP